MSKVRTHTFNRHKYEIDISPLKGIADVSNKTPLTIVVNSDMSDRQILIITIHESLHASNWDKSEDVVTRVANEIGGLLWRLGYRRKEK